MGQTTTPQFEMGGDGYHQRDILRNKAFGRSTRLPKYVLENPAIVSLDCNEHTGLPYKDKLCFFRCLALHRGCHPHNLERNTQHYFERYVEDAEDFDGLPDF